MRKSAALGLGAWLLFFTAPLGFCEPSPQFPFRAHTAPSAEERVDINTASLEDLLKIPGMTRTWAARIIRFRPYRAKNDLIDRGVLSDQVYSRIKDYVIAHRAKQ